MTRTGVVRTAFILAVLLGTAGVGYARQEQQHEKQGKPAKPAEADKHKSNPAPQGQTSHQQPSAHQAQGRPAPPPPPAHQAQSQPYHQQQPARQAQGQAYHQQPPAQMHRTQQQLYSQQVEQRAVWQNHRAHTWESEHRTWQQRGGYNGYRVPDYYFHTYYGPSHWFRVYSVPFMVVGMYPRFQYGGYWFSLVDPYPEYWGPNWYETDDVFVDYYGGGYYLYNRRYPGRPGIAISISF